MSKSIPPLDLMFLLTESPNSPKHVGAIMTFKLPATGASRIGHEIAEAYRAAEPRPPFNYIAEFPATALPRWKTVEAVDMEHHVQHIALPAGTTYERFLHLVESLHETVLDRNRPGFRIHIIEGLPDNTLAMYIKIHHAIVDGLSAMALLVASMNEAADTRRIQPFFALQLSEEKLKPPKGLLEQIMSLQLMARKQSGALKDFYVGMLKKGVSRLLGSEGSGSVPFAAPRTPMNQPIRVPRAVATLSLPIDEMRAVGKAFGGTLNDVAATIVDAGLHRYLADVDKGSNQALVAMCPVSLRAPDDKEATTKVTAMFVPLGAPSASPRERMEKVMAAIASAKDEVRAMSKDAAMLYGISAFALAELAETTQLSTSVTKPIANFVLSNVPGARTELHLNGLRLTGMYPISALGAGIGLNVTLASYAASMDFGFVGNGMTLPNVTDFARYTGEAFASLRAEAIAAHAPSAEPQRAPVRKRPRARAPVKAVTAKRAGGSRGSNAKSARRR